MKTLTLVKLISSMAVMTTAAPLEVRDAANILVSGVTINHKRPNGDIAQKTVNVYVCRDTNFSGSCQNLASTANQCYNLGNGFADSISSLGPSKGVDCNFYNDINCSSAGGNLNDIAYPGVSNLATYAGGKYNDVFSSYACF